jgi:hypothetical protein
MQETHKKMSHQKETYTSKNILLKAFNSIPQEASLLYLSRSVYPLKEMYKARHDLDKFECKHLLAFKSVKE